MSTPQSISDQPAVTASGYLAAAAVLVLALAGLGLAAMGVMPAVTGWAGPDWAVLVLAVLVLAAACLIGVGVYTLQPNESAVITLFGAYKGTDHTAGLRWTNPFCERKRVSRRLQTHQIEPIKVNDASGNPIEIGAAVVWHVRDSAKSVLEVDDYRAFVALQSETALRKVANSHPYDDWNERDGAHQDGAPEVVSLRDGGDQITDGLARELRSRLAGAGIEVVEARITHLAYAPEIANAMLRRQQAAAVVAARRTIVKGAVELVKEALIGLKDRSIEIDDERQAAMVSNMLVVLVGDKDATPVINAGTLHG